MKRLFTQTFLENSLKTTPTKILLQNRKNTLATPYVGILLMLLLCLFKVEMGKGQGTASYLATLKQKNYIPLPVQSSPTDFLLAGTEGDFEGDINVKKVDGLGNVLFDITFTDPNHKKTVVDFTYTNIGGSCLLYTSPSPRD